MRCCKANLDQAKAKATSPAKRAPVEATRVEAPESGLALVLALAAADEAREEASVSEERTELYRVIRKVCEIARRDIPGSAGDA